MVLDIRLAQELLALRNRLRDALEQAEARALGGSGWPGPHALEPAVDVWETAEEVVVEVELPGARVADITLRLDGQVLLVAGHLPSEVEENARYLRMERPRGAFSRHIPLPVDVAGEPRATLRGGVLRVSLPRAEAPRHRRIPVQQEGP